MENEHRENLATTPDPKPLEGLYTVRQFCERNAWATPGGIRHLIFYKDRNGFAPCVRRIGGRILIDEARVSRYIEEQSGTGDSAKEVQSV